MAPFTYDTPPPSPLVGSIGDLIARGGLQRAQLAEALAQTQSRAQVANAQAWGNATQSLGQLPIQMQEQARRDQLANVDTAYKLTQMQGAQAQLADQQQQRARRLAAGLALQKSIAANTDPTTGEIDAQKVFTDVSGPFPDDADAWLKSYSGAQSAFDARAKSKRADADAESVLVGRLAQAAPSAAAFVDSLATAQAADHVSKKTLARVTQDLATTNAWDPLKAQYVSTADALLPPVTLKDGETLVNAVSNTPRAEQPKEIKVDPGQKVYQGTNPDGTPKLLLQGGDKEPEYTREQLDYAKTQGHDKPTLGDMNAVATIVSNRAIAQSSAEHAANRNYDNAHPAPPPPPVVLNDHQKSVATDLASGNLTFSEFNKLYPSRAGVGQEAKAAMYDYARELNPAFAPAQFEAGYKMATNPQVTQRLVAINALAPVIDKITTLAASAGNTDMPTFNALLQQANFEVGGKHIASLRQLQTLLGEEVGNALGVGSGSDLKTKLGLDLVNPTLGPKDFLDTMQQLQSVLGARKQTLLGTMGVYGQGSGAVPVAQPPGGTTVGKYHVQVAP